jgi:hypothetical protein
MTCIIPCWSYSNNSVDKTYKFLLWSDEIMTKRIKYYWFSIAWGHLSGQTTFGIIEPWDQCVRWTPIHITRRVKFSALNTQMLKSSPVHPPTYCAMRFAELLTCRRLRRTSPAEVWTGEVTLWGEHLSCDDPISTKATRSEGCLQLEFALPTLKAHPCIPPLQRWATIQYSSSLVN